MIIQSIGFHNFLRFFGDSSIDLSPTIDEPSTLALILAPNDSGKTSVMRGMEFLLYGTVEGKSGDLILAALVNDEAVRTASLAEITNVRGHVEATLLSKGVELTVRRSVSIELLPRGERRLRSSSLSSLEGELRKEWKPDQGGILAFKLERLMPRALFHYFFFQGEGLADALIEKQDPKIKEGLSGLLHEDDWQEAINDLQSLLNGFNADCRRAAGQDQELQRAVDRLEGAEKHEADCRKKYEAGQVSLTNIKNEAERLTGLVAESVGQVDLDAGKKLEQVKAKIASHQSRLTGARHGLLSTIGGTRGLPFLARAFEPVRAILQDLREQNLLPADVSEGFVGRILKRGKCMCGCELETGSPQRKSVENFRASSLSAELNTDLFQLYNLLEEGSARGFEAEIQRSLDTLTSSTKFIEAETINVSALEAHERALKARVDEVAQQRCRDLLRDQTRANDQRASMSAQVQEMKSQWEVAIRFKDQAKRELNQLRSKPGAKAAESAIESRALTAELIQVLETGLSGLKNSLRRPLQDTISNLYDPVAKDGSKAQIADSLLPRIEKDGRPAKFLGGGQKQVLCLAYIIALAQLRKNLHEALRGAGVMVPVADDQSFVMDSIFGQCEPEYQEAICKFLPGQTGQILLLLAGQQWTETVQEALSDEVDLLFGFEYHSPNTRYDESKHRFTVGGKVHKLLKSDVADQTAYTVIKQLTF